MSRAFARMVAARGAVVAVIAVAATGLCMLGGGAGEARAQAPEVRTYVVQPGDSVWSIAEEFYGNGDKYPIIYQYNDFAAKPPFLLKPGQTLRLPILGAGPEGKLDWLLKDVKAKPPRALDWLVARERMNLWRLYRVSTGDESAARIVFEDQSDIKLRENALLVIYGASASAARTQRRDKVEVMLEQGTLQGGLASLDEGAAQKPMVVNTPSGQIDLMAKLAQVQADIAGAIVSVYEGNAVVKAEGEAVSVQGGQGTVVEKGKKPEKPRPLPAPPEWVEATTGLVAVVAPRRGSYEAAWRPAERAATYRVELATDATFAQILYDAEVGAGVTKLRLADLAPGKYAVRVSTRDAKKLESKPGRPRLVEVVGMASARAIGDGQDGVLEAVGFAELMLAPELAARATVSVDGGAERAGTAPVRLFGVGKHDVRVSVGAEKVVMPVRVLAVSATIEVDGEPLAREAATARVKVVDERGRAALLPGLACETSRGEKLALAADAHDVYRADVPEPGDGRLALRVSWLGGELATREIQYEADVVAAEGERVQVVTLPYRVTRLAAGPLAPPLPETRVGLETGLVALDDGPGQVAVALDGEWELDAWGIAARLVAQQIRLSEGDDPQSRVGDVALVVRRGIGDEHLALTPYLRIAVPIGSGHEQKVTGFEPGVQGRWRDGVVSLDGRLALLATPGLDVGSVARGELTVALGWHPNALVSLALSAETLIGDEWHNLVGVGATFALGPARIGGAFGVGLGDTTRDDYGAWLGRVVVDIGAP